MLQTRAGRCITEHIKMICILQFVLYLSTPLLSQDEANGDDETDVKPFLSFSVDGADLSQEMEECSIEETK